MKQEDLRMAEADYDAFVTRDQGIPHQHIRPSLDLAMIILRAE